MNYYLNRVLHFINSLFDTFVLGYQFWNIFGSLLEIAFLVLTIIGMWKIFTKAGEEGWASLIPFYNKYVLFKISDMKGWFWSYLLAQILCFLTGAGIVVILIGLLVNLFTNTWISSNALWMLLLGCMSLYGICTLYFFVLKIVNAIKLTDVFDLSAGYAIGLILIPAIFYMVIGFVDTIRYKKGRQTPPAGPQNYYNNNTYGSYPEQNPYMQQTQTPPQTPLQTPPRQVYPDGKNQL